MQTQFNAAHYSILAVTMRNATPPVMDSPERRQHYADCKALATMLGNDNPWFNANLFMYNCGYQMEGMAP